MTISHGIAEVMSSSLIAVNVQMKTWQWLKFWTNILTCVSLFEKLLPPSAFYIWRTSKIRAFSSSPTAITVRAHTRTHTITQSHISMSILLSIFHVQLLCYGNRRRLAMGWLLTADFRSFSLFSPAVLLLVLNALLTHSCLLISSQSLRGVHSMISVIIPCLLAPRPTVIPSVPPLFLPSSLAPSLS